MTEGRYSGPEPAGNGAAFVTHDEFDEFKGNVFAKLGSVERAITSDARARSKRDQLITEQLERLSSAQRQADSNPPSSNRYDDITGRFDIQKREIIQKTNRSAPVYSGIGAAVAYGIFEAIKLLLQMRGH